MDHMFTLTGTTLTVHLPSEVDHHSTELLQRETDQLIQSRNIRCILFDFGDTVFMDSSGIGMLLGRYKMIRFVGGTMAAINVKERMRRVLLLSGVYRVIDIYEGLPQQSKLLRKRKHSPNPMETVTGWLCRRSVGCFAKRWR